MRDANPLNDGRRLVVASRLIARTAAKYARRLNATDLEGDLVADAWVELLSSAHRWDPALGDWEGYVLTLAARTVRRSLYVARAPVSGSPWRAHRWGKDLHADGVEVLDYRPSGGAAPDTVACDAEFMEALRDSLMDVPGCELALGVLLDGGTPGEVAQEHRVDVSRVRGAVRAAKEQATANLGHFAPGRRVGGDGR